MPEVTADTPRTPSWAELDTTNNEAEALPSTAHFSEGKAAHNPSAKTGTTTYKN